MWERRQESGFHICKPINWEAGETGEAGSLDEGWIYTTYERGAQRGAPRPRS